MPEKKLELRMVLVRDVFHDDTTLGRLYVDGAFECFTLEDAVRERKIDGQTAIPAGTYRVLISFSNRFKKHLPLLLKVPNFEGVRIHSGNTSEDTRGCILVGQQRGVRTVLASRAAMQPVMEKITDALAEGKAVWIEIREQR